MGLFVGLFSGVCGILLAGGSFLGWVFLVCVIAGYVPFDPDGKGGHKRG